MINYNVLVEFTFWIKILISPNCRVQMRTGSYYAEFFWLYLLLQGLFNTMLTSLSRLHIHLKFEQQEKKNHHKEMQQHCKLVIFCAEFNVGLDVLAIFFLLV